MKIYFYINVIGGGGAERVIANLSTQFSEHGYNVGLITSFPIEEEYPIGEKVKRFNLEKEEIIGDNRVYRNFRRIYELRKILKDNKPDVLVSFMAEPNFRAIIAAMGLRTKTIVSVRNDPNREYAGKIGYIVGKLILPLANGCVFQTDEAKRWFPQKLQKKSLIIFNSVKKDFYNVEHKPEKGRIATFGRLNTQKNQKMLIEAFSQVVKEFPYAVLWIYGQGKLEQELAEQIGSLGLKESVELKGNTLDVPSALAQTDIFVLSSDYEGMPNALMEAMAVGIPVISTDCPCGGPGMIIDNMSNGILVPVDNYKEMANALQRLLSDQQLRISMKEKAKEKAKLFETDCVFYEWEKYIRSVLQQ